MPAVQTKHPPNDDIVLERTEAMPFLERALGRPGVVLRTLKLGKEGPFFSQFQSAGKSQRQGSRTLSQGTRRLVVRK